MRLHKIIMLCLLVACSLPAEAQNLLKGSVQDQDDHALADVHIFMPDLKRSGVTDDAGNYEIGNLPAGRFKIQVSHIGYKISIQTIRIKSGENSFDVALTSSPIRAEEIVVTAATFTAPERTAYNVSEVSAHTIQTEGAVTLTEALTETPGVTQLSTGLGISKPVIRGLYGNRVLTVINGFRFDNQQWQDEHGLGLSDAGLDKVEIIKGPASLLYGSDALGGVLNLIDEKPAPYGKTVGNYNIGLFSSTLGANTDIGLKGTRDAVNWKIRLGGQTHADYLDGDGERVPNTRFNGMDFKSDFGLTQQKFITNLNYHFSFYQFGVVEQEELESGKKEEHFEREMEGPHHTVKYHLLTSQTTFFLGNSRLEVDAGGHWNSREEAEGAEEMAGPEEIGELDMELSSYSLAPKLVVPYAEGGEFIAGVQANLQTNRNHGERLLIPDANTREVSAFGFLKHPVSNFIFEGGLRYNRYHLETKGTELESGGADFPELDNNYNTVNSSLGLVCNLSENLLFKGNIASGYRAPNLAELASNGLHEGTLNFEIGDPNLDEEKNVEVDVSGEYTTSFVALAVDAYYNHIDNFIYLSPTTETIQGFNVYRFLQSDANLKGVEIGLNWVPEKLGWLDLRSRFSKIIGKLSGDSYLPLMPADRLVNEARLGLNKLAFLNNSFIKLTLTNVFKQDNTAEVETETPAYNLVDIALGGTVNFLSRRTEVTLACKNLFGEVYYDHLSRIKPGSFNDPGIGFNNIGRNIFLYMNVPFEM